MNNIVVDIYHVVAIHWLKTLKFHYDKTLPTQL